MKADIEFLKELCRWLANQKGAIPQSYAKQLAKMVISLDKKSK